MKFATCISIALVMSGLPSALAAAEQCRFIEARPEREACYQRQETARAARQKALETQQAAQPTPYEPTTPEDAIDRLHPLPPTSFAKVSRRPMVRLNTGLPAAESLSRTK